MTTKLDRSFVQHGLDGAENATQVISALAAEVERLEKGMSQAVEVARKAKNHIDADGMGLDELDEFLTQWGLS